MSRLFIVLSLCNFLNAEVQGANLQHYVQAYDWVVLHKQISSHHLSQSILSDFKLSSEICLLSHLQYNDTPLVCLDRYHFLLFPYQIHHMRGICKVLGISLCSLVHQTRVALSKSQMMDTCFEICLQALFHKQCPSKLRKSVLYSLVHASRVSVQMNLRDIARPRNISEYPLFFDSRQKQQGFLRHRKNEV